MERNFKESLKILVDEFNLKSIILGTRSTDPYCNHLDLLSPSDTDKGNIIFLIMKN